MTRSRRSGFYNASAFAPAYFGGGQSNDGIQDEIPGKVDTRVSVMWANGIPAVIRGPEPQQLQSGGHSFEWQAATDMAAYFNSEILAGKYWVDGTSIDLWVPPGGLCWVPLAAVLSAFAARCVARGIAKVEFVWIQGESNTPNNVAFLLPTYQSMTNSVFDGVKALLAGYRLDVHFTIIKTNANIVTGPNPSDPSAASLTFIRAAQDALAATRIDTETIDFPDIVPATGGAVHYAHGQTNVGGARIASQMFARYPR